MWGGGLCDSRERVVAGGRAPRHLHVALRRAGDKEVFEGVQCEGFDGRVVRLESVQQLPLADVEHAHESLSASGDQQLLLGGVLQHSRSILVAGEGCRAGGRDGGKEKRGRRASRD